MTSERWKQIEKLYHAVQERSPAERAVLLAQVDSEIRVEVESLLGQNSGDGALDRPAWTGLTEFPVTEATVTSFSPGTQLGPYKIEGPLGAGGMGDVFRAVDTRLERSVAIKTSREQFSARFDREARAISSLNHSHICTLFDVGPNYLVMELCEGETLAARLKRGKLSVDDTLRYGQQVADALAAAHAKGIIHRDLKPSNIMLGKAGIKVLDFGLAKSPQDATMTGSNIVMGTAAYMSPEQREGRECDSRTDIYSLGLVLYEMSTGKRMVPGEKNEQLPEKLAHVIELCVAHDSDDRWRAAADVAKELRWVAKGQSAAAAAPARTGRLPWGVAAFMTLLTVVSSGLYFRESRQVPSGRSTTFLVYPPDKVVLSGFALPVISPDGERLAFGGIESDGKTRLWVRPLSSLKRNQLRVAKA